MGKFGIDVGGVIIDRVKGDDSDTSMFKDRYLETPEVEGAIDTIAKLGRGRFKGNLFIVSKAGTKMRARTMEWLTHRDFWARTGMEKSQAYFTYTRDEKAPVAKRLGLTHFVDDRMEILAYLAGICDHRYLFQGSQGDVARWKNSAVVQVESWKELGEKLA
jgi:hypothetical protein